FQVNCRCISILRILDEENYQERHDRGASIDHELPRIGVVKIWPGNKPSQDHLESCEERPFCSYPISSLRGKNVKSLFATTSVYCHVRTIDFPISRRKSGREFDACSSPDIRASSYVEGAGEDPYLKGRILFEALREPRVKAVLNNTANRSDLISISASMPSG